jgi:hypothetical protein
MLGHDIIIWGGNDTGKSSAKDFEMFSVVAI